MIRGITVFWIVLLVAIAAYTIDQRMDSNALSMAVGVLFGMLASLPTALLVTTQRPAIQHHTHDVTMKINGRWVLLDGC